MSADRGEVGENARHRRVEICIAGRRHDRERPYVVAPDQVSEHREARLVCPLQVVQHDHQGSPGFQEHGDRLEQQPLLGPGFGPRGSWERPDLVDELWYQPRELAAVADGRRQGGGLDRVHQLAQYLDEGCIGTEALLRAPSPQHRSPAGVHVLGETGDQPGLPHAGLADDQVESALGLPGRPELIQLALTSYESRTPSLPYRTRKAEPQSRHRIRPRFELTRRRADLVSGLFSGLRRGSCCWRVAVLIVGRGLGRALLVGFHRCCAGHRSQLIGGQVEGTGDLPEGRKPGRAAPAAFERRYRRRADRGALGKSLLREAVGDPVAPEHGPEGFSHQPPPSPIEPLSMVAAAPLSGHCVPGSSRLGPGPRSGFRADVRET